MQKKNQLNTKHQQIHCGQEGYDRQFYRVALNNKFIIFDFTTIIVTVKISTLLNQLKHKMCDQSMAARKMVMDIFIR